MMNSVLTSMLLLVTVFNFSAVSAQTFSFSQNATGPSSVCEGSNVTLQCVIILIPGNTVQAAVWTRNGTLVQMANGSVIPNHSLVFNSTTGGFTDLVITDVRMDDNNIVYSCTATGTTITSSVVLNVTGIPVKNLVVVDQCINITVSWDITEESCTNLSYDVTLLSSDGITLQGPNTIIDTVHSFTNVETFNGNLIVSVVPTNGNVRGSSVTETAIIGVSSNDFPTVDNIRNGSTFCVTYFSILWDPPNSIMCGNVSYEVSVFSHTTQGDGIINTTVDTFFSFPELGNSLANTTITVTASNRAGRGNVSTFLVQRRISLTFTIMFNQSQYRVDEGANVTIMLVLCNQSSTNIIVQVTTANGSATGGGVDYLSGPCNVTIPAGQINATVDIPIIDDNVLETDETFTLNITDASPFTDVTVGEATLIIMDNDNITIKFNQSEYRVDEDAANVPIMVYLDKEPPTDFTVEVTSTDKSASEGMDYVRGPYYANFSAGQTIATIYILIIDDNEVENDETFTLYITYASPFTFVTAGEVIFIIVDNDQSSDTLVAAIVGGVVGGVVGTIGIAAIVGFAIFYKYRKNKKNLVSDGKQVENNQKKSAKKPKDKDTIRQPLQEKANSPDVKNMDVYAEVSKDEGDSAEAKQMEQLNYADLDIQRGPNRYGDDCHAVEYGEVAETKQ